MNVFTLRIDLKDGRTQWIDGHTPAQLAEFTRIADTWRQQPPENWYEVKDNGADAGRVYVRDIADMRVMSA